MPETDDTTLPDALLIAVGRVATSSSELESALRYVVSELAGGDDAGWIIFEGQSVDWLIQNGIAVLGQHVQDDEGNSWRLGLAGNQLCELFKEAEQLKNARNFVIHGEWTTYCVGCSMNEPEFCQPRSRESLNTEEVFHVVRSRYRRGFEEQAWSIADIEDVASKSEALASTIRRTYRDAIDARLAKWKADTVDEADA